MTLSAAPTPSCAAVTTPSSHQSASVNRRTIPPVTASGANRVGLWFALVFPSSFIVQKFLGWESTIAYAIAVAVTVTFTPRLTDRLMDRNVRWLALLTIVIVGTMYALAYPIANTHAPGAGSDDDDALNVATMAFVEGRFPYATHTYLGNAVHHLPGAFVLAAPFVLLGTSALQNLFWLTLFFVAVTEERGSGFAVSLAWLVLALSPVVLYEIVTGTGYLSNTISVLLALWWLVRTKHRDVAAVLWGLTLTSRANFILLMPLAFTALRQQTDRPTAIRAMVITSLTIACLTLPFYLHDPGNFPPVEGADRLLVFNQLLPHLGIALITATAALGVALSLTPMEGAALFRHSALVQAFPVVAGVVLSTIRDGRVNLTYARYGTFFAWFVVMAYAVSGRRAEAAAAHEPEAIVR
jgi:hypothetical protein